MCLPRSTSGTGAPAKEPALPGADRERHRVALAGASSSGSRGGLVPVPQPRGEEQGHEGKLRGAVSGVDEGTRLGDPAVRIHRRARVSDCEVGFWAGGYRQITWKRCAARGGACSATVLPERGISPLSPLSARTAGHFAARDVSLTPAA